MADRLLDDEFIQRIEALTLSTRKIFRGRMKGERRSKQRGYSSEFADYRNYVEGDDLRHIDWNIYARLEKLFLKLFLEEEDLHVHILLDTSASMDFGEPNKLWYAKRVAAAVAYVGLVQQDRVQVHAFARGVRETSGALRGRRNARHLFEFLQPLSASGGTSLSETCRLLLGTRTFGKGICILLSDLLDPGGYEDCLKRLLAHKMDVYVVHLLSPGEIEPTLAGDLRLVDAEDGSYQEITVSAPLLKQYRNTLQAFRDGIQTYCTRHGAHYAYTPTDTAFDHLVMTYLRQVGLFR